MNPTSVLVLIIGAVIIILQIKYLKRTYTVTVVTKAHMWIGLLLQVVVASGVCIAFFSYKQSNLNFKKSVDVSNTQFNETVLRDERNFDLSNRPLLEILGPSMDIVDTDKNAPRGEAPELLFAFPYLLINHGKLPAHVRNIDCLFLDSGEKRPIHAMPYQEDRHWKNFDVFPSIQPYLYLRRSYAFVNVNDLKDVMQLDDDFYKEIVGRDSVFWKQEKDGIVASFKTKMKQFFLILQIEYDKLRENNVSDSAYFYSVKFRVDNELKCQFEESIFGRTEKEGKWFRVKDGGVVEKI
jgi:hypothetical protein